MSKAVFTPNATTSIIAWQIKSRGAPVLMLGVRTRNNECSSLRHCASRKVSRIIIVLVIVDPMVPTLWFWLPSSLLSTYNKCSCKLGAGVGSGYLRPCGPQAIWVCLWVPLSPAGSVCSVWTQPKGHGCHTRLQRGSSMAHFLPRSIQYVLQDAFKHILFLRT